MIVLGSLLAIAFLSFLATLEGVSKKKLKYSLVQVIAVGLACIHFMSPGFSMEVVPGADKATTQELIKESPNGGECLTYDESSKTYTFYVEPGPESERALFMEALQLRYEGGLERKAIDKKVTEFIELQEGEEPFIEVITRDLIYKEKIPLINHEVSLTSNEQNAYRVHLKKEDLPEGTAFSNH